MNIQKYWISNSNIKSDINFDIYQISYCDIHINFLVVDLMTLKFDHGIFEVQYGYHINNI
jgi:hypothetical protein